MHCLKDAGRLLAREVAVSFSHARAGCQVVREGAGAACIDPQHSWQHDLDAGHRGLIHRGGKVDAQQPVIPQSEGVLVCVRSVLATCMPYIDVLQATPNSFTLHQGLL